MDFDFKKIPTFAYILIITLVVAIIYWIFIGQSLVSNAPAMMKEHEDNLSTFKQYDMALKQEKAIEEQIKKDNQTYETKQKELFISLDTCSKELEKYCSQKGIKLDNYAISDPNEDSKNRTSSAGYPVYTVDISLSYTDTYAKTLDLLKYIERTSQGCYYVNSCKLDKNDKISGDNFDTKLSLRLYYYDTTQSRVQPTEPATSKAS